MPQKMTAQIIFIIILTGLVAGMMSGLVGIGGGLIIVPSLIYFLGFSQHQAQGTSLGLIMLPVGILGVMQYYKAGNIDPKVVALLAIGFLVGSYFGSKISLNLSQAAIKKVFAVFLILIAIKMLFFENKKHEKPNAKNFTKL
jgi:uncharacterized protein